MGLDSPVFPAETFGLHECQCRAFLQAHGSHITVLTSSEDSVKEFFYSLHFLVLFLEGSISVEYHESLRH